ncbi:hypothetical protein ACRE_008860 [Hapsidospora chrysogenum ATCC 11550]|uniref:Uncharacterized protein n=1 Tax=Hapsidospora chrysogenum (strain ATCC 11550 / CBS 779.69 / DSM 880 / IAM 14645 / JCM 23072 / IMI 49137) TaxID=857340 RepID=A0A086TFS0_HAPC1|nr:hypothetical protein ACRE_008860 [Hapsidospora chrysogenum ATCC 11550]
MASSSIAIPQSYMGTPKGPASCSGSSYSSSPPSSMTSSSPRGLSQQSRRPSLLSTAISKQESTVINIGDPDGPPRLALPGILVGDENTSPRTALIRLTHSLTEIFLPSYVDCDYEPLENRREPVHDILLTDEELKQMLPQ